MVQERVLQAQIFNTCLGYNAGQSSTGGGNTFVGYYSDVSPSAPNVSNSGSFGFQAIATAATRFLWAIRWFLQLKPLAVFLEFLTDDIKRI